MAKTSMVITIGRQYGSGGRVVGRTLAEKLEIPYYDKELLVEAAKDSGICQELFEDHDEKLKLKRSIQTLSKAAQKNNPDTRLFAQLPQAINTIIRCKLNIRRMDNLKAEDIPKATEIVNQIGNIILEGV